MPDITMCDNIFCKNNLQCLRFTSIPNPTYQSFTRFEYDKVSGQCEFFLVDHSQSVTKKDIIL